MAIVTNFYNGDMARPIREIITQNFANVAKYIPNNFISLTTIERQNLLDDYKTHFKLVFDKEQEFVYRWSEVERNWKQYLIRARDEYARREANQNSETAFVDAEIGIDMEGQPNPYTITFYNRPYDSYNAEEDKFEHHNKTAKDSIFLRALNIEYDSQYSVQTIIDKIIRDFNSLNDFVGDRTLITDNPDIDADTVTGAIKEINQKTIDNKQRLDNIMDGTTPVPEAIHANEADHALRADVADNAEKLGGQLPSYYATQAGLDATNTSLTNTIARVEKNESDIAELQEGLEKTNQDLSDLIDKVDIHDNQLTEIQDVQATHGTDIDELYNRIADMTDQIGWEILDGQYESWKTNFRKDNSYAGYQLKTNFIDSEFDEFKSRITRAMDSINFVANQGCIKFVSDSGNYITFEDDSTTSGTTTNYSYKITLVLGSNKTILATATATETDGVISEASKKITNITNPVTLPTDLGKCTYIQPEIYWFNERLLTLAPSE